MPSQRRIVLAGSFGTAIEWFDFFLYGLVAPLIFDRLFFPKFDPAVATILVFATFAVGFVARPVGGILFGHFGDRIGRKSVLLATLLLMGVSTMSIGLLPTYDSIGIASPLALVTLRFVQGFALGGEAVAAGLLTLESAPTARRGMFASFIQAAGPIGVISASLCALLISKMPEAQQLSWGWRAPFLASGLLVGIGIYVRLRIAESPVFQAAAAETGLPRLPALEALVRHRGPIAIVFFVSMAESAFFYLTAIFPLSFVTKNLGLPKDVTTYAVLIANILAFAAMPLFGAMSDRVGRKPMIAAGVVLAAAYLFFFFGLLESRVPRLIVTAISIAAGILHPLMFGPEASFFPELFPTRVRFSAVSIGKQFGSMLGGGMAPLVAASLYAWSHETLPIAIYFLGLAILASIALLFAKDTRTIDIGK